MSDRNQFYYKRTIVDSKANVKKTEIDSFNINTIIRTMQWGGGAIVMLNDGHEVSEEIEQGRDSKGRTLEPKRQRVWKVSEIVLDKEDRIRLQRVTATDDFPTEFEDEKLPEITVEKEEEEPAVTD